MRVHRVNINTKDRSFVCHNAAGLAWLKSAQEAIYMLMDSLCKFEEMAFSCKEVAAVCVCVCVCYMYVCVLYVCYMYVCVCPKEWS